MNRSGFLFCLLMLGVTPLVQAADDLALQQQLETLQQRVSELERRLNTLDTPQVQQAIRAATGPVNPGHGELASNWEFLKVGYSYDKVRDLLGEPVRIKSGAMEFWFYSDRELDGPFVKFIFNKVNSWKGPQAE